MPITADAMTTEAGTVRVPLSYSLTGITTAELLSSGIQLAMDFENTDKLFPDTILSASSVNILMEEYTRISVLVSSMVFSAFNPTVNGPAISSSVCSKELVASVLLYAASEVVSKGVQVTFSVSVLQVRPTAYGVNTQPSTPEVSALLSTFGKR